ncbi:MAG: MaoC family dehydratase [Candidatus Dormibacteraceae bacterium]
MTRRRTMTEADIAGYAGLAGDFAPTHSDFEFARNSSLGGVVVPGVLISAVALGLGSMDAALPATAAMLESSWKYLAPVRPGDSLSCRWRLNRKRDIDDARLGLVGWQVTVENQLGSVVAEGDVVRLVERASYRAPSGEEPSPPERSGRRRRRGGRGRGPDRAESLEVPEAQASANDAVELDAEAVSDSRADPLGPAPRRRRRRGGRQRTGTTGGEPEIGISVGDRDQDAFTPALEASPTPTAQAPDSSAPEPRQPDEIEGRAAGGPPEGVRNLSRVLRRLRGGS